MTIERTLPGAAVAFTTRRGGVSEGPYSSLNLGALTGDDPARVYANRARAAAAAGTEPACVAMAHQVHGTAVLQWDGPPAPGQRAFADPDRPPPDGDGHTTTSSRVALLVLVADCLPVALASARRVAMLHCGWRGLAGGIVAEAMARFPQGEAVHALVGPGIGRCCYEVGPEVAAAFADVPGALHGRMLDLRAVATARLAAAGAAVEHVDMCTSCNPELFFSHRRDAGVTGRQAGLIRRAA